MILEIQIKGQTTRLNMEQAHALYKELAPLFEEKYDSSDQTQHSYPWWIEFSSPTGLFETSNA